MTNQQKPRCPTCGESDYSITDRQANYGAQEQTGAGEAEPQVQSVLYTAECNKCGQPFRFEIEF